jgi:hypothetical protein
MTNDESGIPNPDAESLMPSSVFVDFVRTGSQRVVKEPLYWLPSDKVLIENNVGVFDLHVTIPDVFRIDDYHGAVSALIHAPGVINSNGFLPSRQLHQFLEAGVYRPGVAIHLGTPIAAGANKDMFLKRTHQRFSCKAHSSTPAGKD